MSSKTGISNVSPRKFMSPKEAEKHRKEKLEAMKAALPVMSHKEVRRYRVEYHRALCCELEEEGYFSASRLINNLVEIDEVRRKRAGPNSLILLKPKLKSQKEMLDCLRAGLKQAEKEERRGQFGTACTVYLNLALYFKERGENWFWVANILFYGSYRRGAKYLTDGRRKETISRFAFGKFLLEDLKRLRRALRMLENARTIAMGKLWKLPDLRAPNSQTDLPEIAPGNDTEEEKEERVGKIWAMELEGPPDTHGLLYHETCILLHKTLLQMAREMKEITPLSDHEVSLCLQALRRAVESETINVQLEALNALGTCYMERDDLETAIKYFEHLLYLSTQNQIWTGICDAHQNLGHVYSRLKSTKDALYHFNELCNAAKNSGSNSLLGKAYRCLGEFHLLSDDPRKATYLLEASFNEYYLQHQNEMLELNSIIEKMGKLKRTMMTSKSQGVAESHKLLSDYQKLKEEGKKLSSIDTFLSLDQTRILAAVAKGIKYLPLYSDLVLQSDTSREAMSALMEWRGNGVPFWKASFSPKPQIILSDEEFSIRSPDTTESAITLPEISSSGDMSTYESDEDSNDLFYFPSEVGGELAWD